MSKLNKNKEYHYLQRIIAQKTGLVIIISLVIYAVIFQLAQGNIGDNFVSFLMEHAQIDRESAFNIYHFLIRGNISVFSVMVLMFILWMSVKIITNSLMNYFDEINKGLDQVIAEDNHKIVLSPELQFLENKMNSSQQILKNRTEDAREAEQRKNDLVTYLAHDIRTPLTSIIGYLSILNESPDLPKEQKQKYLTLTVNKAYQLQNLINEFFDITRFNLQEITIQYQPLKLKLLCEQIAEEFFIIADAKNISIEVTGDEIFLVADPEKLGRAMTNLLKNAIAYSFSNSIIEVCLTQQSTNNTDEAVIQIKNSGATIPKVYQEKIFDRFFRGNEARSTQTGGSGLGLAITKSIIEAHHGRIQLTSENQITIFTVVIPIQNFK